VTKDKDGWDLVKDEDLEMLAELGAGNGGTVTKVWNKKRNSVMAKKVSMIQSFAHDPRLLGFSLVIV